MKYETLYIIQQILSKNLGMDHLFDRKMPDNW